MREIGGYIEFEKFRLPMLHENAIGLNCGRNALAYLIETKNITKIHMPKFMCDSCDGVFEKYGVSVQYYSIDRRFEPVGVEMRSDEWLYVVNYYGQLSDEKLKGLKDRYGRIIIDNAQAYFREPIPGIDTIYTCRKFFGVADGAFLYSDKLLDRELVQDESFERMHFLLGRFERTASEFYGEYVTNNNFFVNEPLKRMSKMTENLLHGIDYEFVKNRRTKNFRILNDEFEKINKLSLCVPEGAFMYPLYTDNGAVVRKQLQMEKVYIPTLWPAVFNVCEESEAEYDMAANILPIPVDQRYDADDMKYIIKKIYENI